MTLWLWNLDSLRPYLSVTYIGVIWCNAGFFDSLTSDVSVSHRGRSRIEPEAIAHNSALTALARAKQWQAALGLKGVCESL